MAPIDINNQEINSITLNGNTDIDTVTVNGQTVFTAGPDLPTNGLIAHWRISNTTSPIPADVGNDDITLENGASIDSQSQAVDGFAMEFDGINDYGTVSFTTPNNAVSLSALVYLDQSSHTNDDRFFIESFGPNFWQGGSLGVRGNNTLEGGVDGSFHDSGILFPLQTWTMIGLSHADGSTTDLYINGNKVSSNSGGNVRQSDGFRFGTYRDADSRFWPGYLDAPAVWNVKLSDSEMQQVSDNYGV